MIKVIVDSVSGFTQDEAKKYDIDVIPIRIAFDEKEFFDGVDIKKDEFYNLLETSKSFPKTSLPSMPFVEEMVNKYVEEGNDVLILSMSSGISSTYNVINSMFVDNTKVRVVDTKIASSAIKILAFEALKHKDENIDVVVKLISDLIPRLCVLAAPKTLDYLLKGGRLSKGAWLVGKVLSLHPILTFEEGKLKVVGKQIGMNLTIKALSEKIQEAGIDYNYPVYGCYTKNNESLTKLLNKLGDVKLTQEDDLTLALASHWGPEAFGLIFVRK